VVDKPDIIAKTARGVRVLPFHYKGGAMGNYIGTVYKRLIDNGIEEWENVYRLVSDDLNEAEEAIIAIKEAEKAVSYVEVNFFRYSVKPDVPNSPALIVDIDEPGDLASTDLGGVLPLFNTVLVTFSDVIGRSEKKYLRLGAHRDNLGTSGAWSSELTDFVQTNYANVVAAIPDYVGPSGESHTGGQVQRKVQMRQLHWSRRTKPGFKRGWVPVTP